MLLARRDEPRHWMSISRLAAHNIMLTVAILSTTALNFSNALRSEDIQSTTPIRLSVPLAVDTMLWTDVVAKLVSEMAFFADSRAAFTAVMSGVSSWLDGIS